MLATSKTKICIIIGDPVRHSLSPLMHNHAYKQTNLEGKFIFIAARVKNKQLSTVFPALKHMQVQGITCTAPHKQTVIKYLDQIDSTASIIDAVNTVVKEKAGYKGYNTDWLGVVDPLEKLTDLKNKKIALLGAGGAARAAVYGLLKKGARLTIFNRTQDKAQKLVEEFAAMAKYKAKSAGLDELSTIPNYQIIVNTTSVGLKQDKSLIKPDWLKQNHIVFDAVYSEAGTRLINDAQAKKAQVITGKEMLLYQGIAQYELYTGQKAPVQAMKNILNL
ncbi:MAG: shikimate dehydrogenase [Candidatus Moranbacteria bacterium]|nr:shikimate dehydrogenase [Candidatus Moranbacteria bacterium]